MDEPRTQEELEKLEEKVEEDVTKVEGVVKEEPAAEGEGEEAVVLEHLISPKILERIIEIAQETLDNLGRHNLGVKLK